MNDDAVTLEREPGADPGAGFGATENWRECRQCGQFSMLPRMRPELVADCPRCSHTLWRMRRSPFSFPIACGVAGVLFYSFVLVAPFLEISAYGRFSLAHIETGPVQLAVQDFQLVGLLVLAATVVFPGVKLGLMLVVLIGLESRLLPPRLLKPLFRWYGPLSPWAMVDVYLLGFLVAYTRLVAMATVHLDTALFSLIGLMLSMAAADAALDTEAVWRAIDQADGEVRAAHGHPLPSPEDWPAGSALIGCHRCELVNCAEPGDPCRRCNAVLRRRKPESISRSWAYIAAAICLYIPANIYPVMWITKLAVTQSFTIIGGIIELVDYGLWPLAALVFFASITIPLLKLIILSFMLIETQLGSSYYLIGRTRAFRIIDFIGRWSMIDVFMVSILVALVRFGQFANVRADVGAACFAAVVVLTMFAVESFDPRLMWDAATERNGAEVDGAAVEA